MRTVTQIANGYEFATGQNKKVVVTHHAMDRFRTRFASRFLPADWRGHDSWQVCAEKMFGMFVNADEMPHALRRVWMTWHDTPCGFASSHGTRLRHSSIVTILTSV